MTVTKDMTMGEILSLDPEMANILVESGMHCVGCPSSAMESLEEACMVHYVDVDEVVEALNKKYKMEIPFGASSFVDEFSKKFIKKYGNDEFNKIAKLNFKNINKINSKN